MNRGLVLTVFTLTSLVSSSGSSQTSPPVPPFENPSAEPPGIPAEMPAPPRDPGAPPTGLTAGPPDIAPPADSPPEPAPAPAPATIDPAPETSGSTEVDAKLDGLNESLATTRGVVDRLARIKVSGYIQGRYEWHGDSAPGLTSAGRPADTNRFFVRRGRLKTTYDGTNVEYMLQIDATGDGVVLKDAEATFVDTWSPLGLRFTIGQFKWPFGYEVLQSSGDREMPERSLVIRRQFPGERDRGLRIQGKHDQLRFAAALVNGNGTQDPIYAATDQNSFKDLVGRLGADFDWLVLGLSGYWGRTLQTTAPSAATLTWTDRNMDNMITADELTGTAAKAASYRRFAVGRLGLDAQAYFDIPGLGGLALKGEFVFAKLGNRDPGALNATMTARIPQSCYDVTSIGWILTVVQNIGDYVGVVLRVDTYDPNYSKAVDSGCPTTFVTAGQGDRVVTTGGGLLLFGSANVKGTLTYEHLSEQSKTVKNDIFTAQLQARF